MTIDIGKGVKMSMVYIAPGEFEMAGGTVKLTKGYYIGKYEVTQEQYETIMGKNPIRYKGAKNPVEQVTWSNAVGFCQKVSKKTGKKFRLPTEAEWEYACRAGTMTKYYTGDSETNLAAVGWYCRNSGQATHKVGRKPPNKWGLYDMHGNVFEWCGDWYAGYGAGDAVDPRGGSFGSDDSDRIFRSGSLGELAKGCRSATRYRYYPSIRSRRIGFRVISFR